MKREVRLLPKATADMADAQFFYEEQSPALGQHFRDSVNSDLRALLVSAGVHRRLHGFHRSLAKRFPHVIFYRVDGDTVLVYAVLDCRRDPDTLRDLLSGR